MYLIHFLINIYDNMYVLDLETYTNYIKNMDLYPIIFCINLILELFVKIIILFFILLILTLQ